LESISIPATVSKIGDTKDISTSNAGIYLPFYNCTSLKTVRFEDGATPISLGVNYSSNSSYAKGLFSYAPLEEVYIGRNIEYANYPSYLFASYPYRYGYSAFYNKTKLTKATIGETVTDIPAYLFYECTALSSVDFGTSLKSIPKYAFSSCALESVELPNTVLSIGERAFESNSKLASINIGSSVETIGNYAFYSCSRLSDLQLGQKLTAIGDYAFASMGIGVLIYKALVLPETLTTIGRNAFSSSGLQSVYIPDAVSFIGESAFALNTRLSSITFGKGCKILPVSVLDGCTELTELILSEGIETISDKAFASCTALESISIPATVSKIGDTKDISTSNAG
ncbi:MAG: leucine-rich repeat domain-containing protein, partial [Muribaculaceae bacterium]|nr:leucine-rich repeat domain-containing protein [Muribaculaceae bacterium]